MIYNEDHPPEIESETKTASTAEEENFVENEQDATNPYITNIAFGFEKIVSFDPVAIMAPFGEEEELSVSAVNLQDNLKDMMTPSDVFAPVSYGMAAPAHKENQTQDGHDWYGDMLDMQMRSLYPQPVS